MAVIRSSVISVTKKEYDTSVAQQTADEAKQETIEINKTLTEVDKRVSEAQSKADESLEKAQEGFDKAEALSEKVDVNTGDISTVKQTTAGLQTAVKSKADSSVVTQLADVVASKVSNVDFESNKTQTAELISSTVERLTIGESNYLYDSNFKSGAKNLMNTSSLQARNIWRNSTTNGTIKSIVPMVENGFTAALKFKSAGTGQHMVAQDFIPCKKNQSVVLSGWFKAVAAGQGIQVQVGQGNAASDLDTYKGATFVASKANTWQKFEFVKVTDADTFTGVFLGGHNQIASEVWFANVKLEKGEKSTPWSESDFELASQSQISQLADNINLKVDTGDVINQINIDPKGIIISGKKISLDGDVSVLPGFKLKAETINGGTFNGNSFIKAIDIRTNDGNLPIEIKGKSSIDDAGIIIEQKTKDTTSGGIISDSRSILNNGLTVGTALDAANGDRRIDYTKDYSQVAASGVVTPSVTRTSDRAVPYWNGAGSNTLTDSSALVSAGIVSSANAFYAGVGTDFLITDKNGYNNGGGVTYKPIRASAFTVSSSRDVKKNIEDYSGDALELVNGTRVTEYNLKDENEDIDYKRIGLIVQESPLEIINFNGGDSIDLYEMASILWKSVQELDAKNKTLEKEKNNLNERLSKIESLLNLDKI